MLLFILFFNGPLPEQVVKQFEAAFHEKNIEKMTETFAAGSVRIDLFAAHNFGNTQEPFQIKAVDAAQRWRQVTPILFNVPDYQRKILSMETKIDGDMAMVWAKIKAGTPNNLSEFTEVYLLKSFKEGWKIAAITNNRQTD